MNSLALGRALLRTAQISCLCAIMMCRQAPAGEIQVYQPSPQVTGEVTCGGGDTMQPLVEAWTQSLQEHIPLVRVSVDASVKLAAGGFAGLLEGRFNCAMFVREPFPSELRAFEDKFGYEPLLISVANGSYDTKGGTHAIAIYVNISNPVDKLTLDQLDAIFSRSLRRGFPRHVTRWEDLGYTDEWAKRPVHVYGMIRQRDTGNPPGIVNFFQQRVLLGGSLCDELLEQKDRPGESSLQAIVNRVAEDPDGIGFSGFGFGRAGVKALAIGESADGPFYSGGQENVAQRLYPLSRQIYILVNRAPQTAMPEALREFLLFAVSSEGQALLAKNPTGFLPLTADQAQEARSKIR